MRALLLTLAIISAGACGGLAWVLARPTPPDPRVGALVAENAQLKQETVRLREQVGKLESAVAKAEEKAATAPAAAGAQAPKPLAENNPPTIEISERVKSLMDRTRADQVDLVYAKLMVRLGLNDQEKAHFRQLLIERERVSTEAALRAARAPKEDRQRLSQEMIDQRKAFDETFKTFLNNKDDYEVFKQWEDTKPERSYFERNAKPLFANSSEPLNDTQEEQLIELMARGRRQHGPAILMPSVSKLDAAAADAKIAEWRQLMTQAHEAMQQEAAAVLTPRQLEIFSAYLGQHRDSLERTARSSASRAN